MQKVNRVEMQQYSTNVQESECDQGDHVDEETERDRGRNKYAI